MTTINEAIDGAEDRVAAVYDAIKEKGVTPVEEENLSNIPDLIRMISTGFSVEVTVSGELKSDTE